MHEQRLTKPLIRREEFYPKRPLSPEVANSQGGKNKRSDYAQVMPAFREATWDEALDLIAARLLAIKAKHGPRALAGFGSAKCSNEEAYLFQKLMRAALGTNNVDHCTRLCHASSVAALLEGIGSGAVSDVFGHAKHADLILLTGSNPTSNHPVAATFFKQAVKQDGVKLVVVDVRRPDIADHATHYCQIRPGTDVAFYNAIMHELIATTGPTKSSSQSVPRTSTRSKPRSRTTPPSVWRRFVAWRPRQFARLQSSLAHRGI